MVGEMPRLSSDLGRRHFLGQITSAQFQAGLDYGRMLAIYDGKILGVKRSVASSAGERIGSGLFEDHEDWDDDQLATFKQRFLAVDEGLKTAVGIDSYRATREMCRGNFSNLYLSRQGLDHLVTVFRIDPALEGEPQIGYRAKRKVQTDAPED